MPKAEIGPDGEPLPIPEPPKVREPTLPEFKSPFQKINKDATDSQRQQQMQEIKSMRDFLARAHQKRDEKDKTQINIPLMKTFERAILVPQEFQTSIDK